MQKFLNIDGLDFFYRQLKSKIDERLPYERKTTAQWNTTPNLLSEAGFLYIYSDYRTITKNGQQMVIPGLKVGDGITNVADLPFVAMDDETVLAHLNNASLHVSGADRTAWNDKVRCYLDTTNPEILVFTTN